MLIRTKARYLENVDETIVMTTALYQIEQATATATVKNSQYRIGGTKKKIEFKKQR